MNSVEIPRHVTECGLQNFIENMVEEIVLEDRTFNSYKDELQRRCEEAGVDYVILEYELEDFLTNRIGGRPIGSHALEDAGCFAIVLEKIPAKLAERVTKELKIPIIGIGAGQCDGQVLVIADMLGMTKDFSPKFLRRYADLNSIMTEAIGNYITDVKACDFPNSEEQY